MSQLTMQKELIWRTERVIDLRGRASRERRWAELNWEEDMDSIRKISVRVLIEAGRESFSGAGSLSDFVSYALQTF